MPDHGKNVLFDGNLHISKRPVPTTGPNEVLIKLHLGGICNTDLELTKGYKAFSGVLGHEFVGHIAQGPEERTGQRVVGEINIACGTCDMCQMGNPSQCRARFILGMQGYDGAFADFFRMPLRNLWPVPANIPDREAVFTEPLAAACQILEAAHISPTERIVLIGAGKLGLLCAQVIRLVGADLTVVVRRAHAASLLERWGIRAVDREDVPDGRADIVVDCTGNADGFATALTLVRPRGTIVLKSTYVDLPQADLTRLVVDEIRVIGSRCGPFGTALNLLKNGLVDVEALIEAEYSLTEADLALEHAARPGALKILLTPTIPDSP